MKRSLLFPLALLVLPAAAQAAPPKPAAAPAKPVAGAAPVAPSASDAIVAAMAKYAEPGPEHEKLRGLEGDWETALTVYLGGKAQAVEKGRAEFFTILGGRFIAEEYRGTFLGKNVSSYIVFGYDNARKKYVSSRFTSLGTEMMMREGTADATGNVITLTGDAFDVSGGKPSRGRMVYTFSGKDKVTVEVFETREGAPEARLFDVVYTRKPM